MGYQEQVLRVVYVAGPYQASTPHALMSNIIAAEGLAREIAEAGAVPLCPHSFGRYADDVRTREWWLEATTELLMRCDAMCTVEGWEDSEGTRDEVATARANDIPVYHGIEEVRVWLAGLDEDGR